MTWSTDKWIPDETSDDVSTYATFSGDSYVLPWAENTSLLRVDSIGITNRFQAYGTESCTPPTESGYGMDASGPSTTLTVHYTNVQSGTSYTRVRTWNTTHGDGTDIDLNNMRLWQLMDGFDRPNEGNISFQLDTNGNVTLWLNPDPGVWTGTGATTDTLFYLIRVRSDTVPADTCMTFLPLDNTNGTFAIEDADGSLVYRYGAGSDEVTIPIRCLPFCEDLTPTYSVSSVVSAGATTWRDEWSYPSELHGTWEEGNPEDPFGKQPSSPYHKGELGKIRPDGSWVFRTEVLQSDAAGLGVQEGAGTFDFVLLNWGEGMPTQDPSWLKTTTIETYSPSGDPIEEQNILGISSAARFDHDGILPGVVAANAHYGSIDFMSFEDPDETAGYGADLVSTTAHTGKHSLQLLNGWKTALSLTVDSSMIASFGSSSIPNGLLVRFWARRTYGADPASGKSPIRLRAKGDPSDPTILDGTAGPVFFEDLPDDASSAGDTIWQAGRVIKIAQTGQWSLYQTYIDNIDVAALGTSFWLEFRKNFGTTTDTLWIDDVRAQPVSSQSTCYVYDDDDMRLMAQFDDQHFSVRYQYNGEGQLVRRLVETERGVFTVVETHYNTPTLERTLPDPPPVPPPGVSQGGILSSTYARDAREQQRAELLLGEGAPTTIDVLSFSAGPDGVEMGLLGSEPVKPSEIIRMVREGLNPDSIDFSAVDPSTLLPGLPDSAARAEFDELMALDSKVLELEEAIAQSTEDPVATLELEQRLLAVRGTRDRLIKKLVGSEPSEIRSFYRGLRSQLQESGGSEEEGTPATRSSTEKE